MRVFKLEEIIGDFTRIMVWLNKWNDDGNCCYVDLPQYYFMSGITNEQAAYYRYWRGRLTKGKFPMTNPQYVQIRIIEILTTDIDPEEGARELRAFVDHAREFGGDQKYYMRVLFDYALVQGLKLPQVVLPNDDAVTSMSMSNVLCYPAEPMEMDFMKGVFSKYAIYSRNVDGVRLLNLFNDSVADIDCIMHNTTGQGI